MNELQTERIGKLLMKLSIPAIIAQLINALYNIVDRIYIARIPNIGTQALTGVGVAFPIIVIIMAFAALVGMGGGPRASIEMGRGHNNKAEKIMGNSLFMVVTFAIVLTIIFSIFKRPLLMSFGASDATISYATDYLGIYLLGSIFVMFTLSMNSFITAQGFAKFSMATVLIGAIINIILDPVLIFGFSMGVKGAALASVISQAVSAVWVLKFVTGNKTILKLKKDNLVPDSKIMFSIAALGISPFIMQSTESLLSIVLNTSLQRYGGDIAVGSMTIITSISQFALMPVMGFVQGAQPIISYNYGAGDMKRVKKAIQLLITSTVCVTTLYCILCQIIPRTVCSIFTSDTALLDNAGFYIRIYMAGMWATGFQMGFQNAFLALGEAKKSLFLAILRKIILLIPLVYIFSSIWGTIGVFTAEPVADIAAATTTTIMFCANFRKIAKQS